MRPNVKSGKFAALATAASLLLAACGDTAVSLADGGGEMTAPSTLPAANAFSVPAPSELTYPDTAPAAPQADSDRFYHFGALRREGNEFVIQLEAGKTMTLSYDGSPWTNWTGGEGVITDIDASTPAALYVATCCAPAGTIWREAVQEMSGTHIDHVVSPYVLRAIADPSTSTIRIEDILFDDIQALDVAIVDRRTVAVLVGDPMPQVVLLTTGHFFDDEVVDRQVIPLSGVADPCAIAAIRNRLFILVGSSPDTPICAGDRALLLDTSSWEVTATFRTPAPIRSINSNHRSQLIAITQDGDVIMGDFSSEPSWVTLLTGDYLAAYLY